MLHVLLGHGSGLGSSVTIKRDGDEVRVAVALGPDSSATAETERAWLSRMAIRYGGRYELEGGLESLTLPAGDASARDENDALRKELDEARKQGEAYARELAAVFAQGEELASAASQSSFPPAVSLAPSEERFAVLSRFASGIAAELRALLTPLGREIQALKSQQTSAPPGMSSRLPPAARRRGVRGSPRDDAPAPVFRAGLPLRARHGRRARPLGATHRGRHRGPRADGGRGLAPRLERQNVDVDLALPTERALATVAPRAVAGAFARDHFAGHRGHVHGRPREAYGDAQDEVARNARHDRRLRPGAPFFGPAVSSLARARPRYVRPSERRSPLRGRGDSRLAGGIARAG